jgi:hypothetical protein
MGFENFVGVDTSVNAPGVPGPSPAPSGPPPGSYGAPSVQVSSTKGGAPVDQYGNRMDTAAGRAASAKKQQEHAINEANAALEVAAAERAQGNQAAAEEAKRRANQAADRAVSINQQRASQDFFSGVKPGVGKDLKPVTGTSANLESFRQAVKNFDISPVNVKTEEPEKPKPPTPPPTPIQPSTVRPTPTFRTPDPPKPKVVKNPNRDVVNFSREEFSQSSIARLLFEQVGSIELVNIARRETIEGQNPYYTLISNLSSIAKNFDPTSLISRQKSNRNIEDNYSIDLNNKIPDDDYLNRNNLSDFYYIDTNGDLVIELDNLASDEIIDLEIAESGTINLVDEA